MSERSTYSRFGGRVRLSDERWEHIVQRHGDLAERQGEVLRAVRDPERILAGNDGEELAVREIGPGKWLVVVYREMDEDGFIITAYSTQRLGPLNRRKQLWP